MVSARRDIRHLLRLTALKLQRLRLEPVPASEEDHDKAFLTGLRPTFECRAGGLRLSGVAKPEQGEPAQKRCQDRAAHRSPLTHRVFNLFSSVLVPAAIVE